MKKASGRLTKNVTMILVGAMLASGTGCAQLGASDQGVFRIIAIDTSGSARPDLPAYRLITYKLVHGLRAGRDAVRVFRFDYEPHEFLSTVGLRRDDLLKTLDTQLQPRAARDGTRTAKCFEEVARLLDSPDAKGRHVEIYFETDNGNDDSSPEMNAIYDRAAKKIASDPHLTTLHYWGIKVHFREKIPAAFTRLPATTLKVQGDTEAFAN